MNHYPLIGISGSISKTEKEMSIQTCYTNALMKAGALPVLLCPRMDDAMLRQCLNGLDGLLLAGGNAGTEAHPIETARMILRMAGCIKEEITAVASMNTDELPAKDDLPALEQLRQEAARLNQPIG